MVEYIPKNQLNELEESRYSRKFIIALDTSTLYLCINPLSNTSDVTHEDMANKLRLKVDKTRGGVLSVNLDGKITYVKPSTTIKGASSEDLSGFQGEIILFDA